MASDLCNVSFQCSTRMRQTLDELAAQSDAMSRSQYILKILEKAVADQIIITTETRYTPVAQTSKPRGLLGRKHG